MIVMLLRAPPVIVNAVRRNPSNLVIARTAKQSPIQLINMVLRRLLRTS
ncbi:MAG: hypothetical protein LBT83_08795 [Tannerella sp.]|nr:hypothetical protein [Tannerella sp.]